MTPTQSRLVLRASRRPEEGAGPWRDRLGRWRSILHRQEAARLRRPFTIDPAMKTKGLGIFLKTWEESRSKYL